MTEDITQQQRQQRSKVQRSMVWQTYTRRRLLWFITAALALMVLGQWVELFSKGSYQHSQRAVTMTRPGAVWHIDGNSHSIQRFGLPIHSITLSQNADGFREQLGRGTVKPADVEALALYYVPTPADLELLATLPNLNSLTLMSTAGLSAEQLSLLARCSRLKELEVLGCEGYERTADTIHWPPGLEVISLNSNRPLPLQRFKELQPLPHLHVLDTRFDDVLAGKPVDLPIAAALNSFPQLQRLYVYPVDARSLSRIQQQFPRVSVRPAFYNDHRMNRVSSAMFFLICWAAVLMSHVSSQFAGDQASLLPAHAGPHWQVAGRLLLVGIGLQAVYLLAVGVHWLGALGVLGLAGAYVAIFVAFVRNSPTMPGFVNPVMIFPMLAFIFPLSQLLQYAAGSDWDWLLRGNYPLISFTLLTISILALRGFVRWLNGLKRQLEAHGVGNVSLDILNTRAWNDLSTATATVRSGQTRWQRLTTGFDARLEAALKRGGWYRLNEAANTTTPERMLVIMAACVALFGAAAAWWQTGQIDRSWISPRVIAIFCLYLAAMGLIFPYILLLQRRPFFELELLRPVSRRVWCLRWFLSTAVHLLPPAILITIALMYANWPGEFIPELELIAGVSVILLLIPLVYASLLLFATWRWGVWLLMAEVNLFVFGFVILQVVRWDTRVIQTISTPDGLITVVISQIVLATSLIWLAWRRWQGWQLAGKS